MDWKISIIYLIWDIRCRKIQIWKDLFLLSKKEKISGFRSDSEVRTAAKSQDSIQWRNKLGFMRNEFTEFYEELLYF